MRVLLLLSGGMDSAALAWKLLSQGHEIQCLSFDYGQKHATQELEAARNLTRIWEVPHDVVDLSPLAGLITSGLMATEGTIPEGHYAHESMKKTVVPNRNMVMLSMAGAVAISRDLDTVAFAAHAGDHHIYPDCRPLFADSMARTFKHGHWHEIKLLYPFISLTKAQIITRVPYAPYDLTWSCYNGRERHCGRCGTCVERREAFVLAGRPDPTVYEDGAGDLADLLDR